MDKFEIYKEYDINLIKTILITDCGIGIKRTNKLIYMLEKKLDKRYNPENKIKDNEKMLLKYKSRRNSNAKSGS